MKSVTCSSCSKSFIPKPGGYNAKYCSGTCKNRAKRSRTKARAPEKLKEARARSYAQTKKHSDRWEAHKKNSRLSMSKPREWLAQYKIGIGCVDCGYNKHFAALQLDHEGPKSISIANARSSVKRLREEIDKGQCKVRCANCHSIRTWERKQKREGKK